MATSNPPSLSQSPGASARVVIIGAGAIGGGVGAHLVERAGDPEVTDLDVLLVARGEHGAAIRARGLEVRTPRGKRVVQVPSVASVEEARVTERDLVLLAVMGQHTEAALHGVPRGATVVSLQNGLLPAARIRALGHPLIAGMVFFPAERTDPGVVLLSGEPVPGAILLGGFSDHERDPAPDFDAPRAHWLATHLARSGIRSEVETHLRPWIRAKLLRNTSNIITALTDDPALRLRGLAADEARAAWDAAGHPYVAPDALTERVGELRIGPIDGKMRVGSSTRYALARGQRLETGALLAPILELAQAHGVPMPINTTLLALAEQAADERWEPGRFSLAELERAVGVDTSTGVTPQEPEDLSRESG